MPKGLRQKLRKRSANANDKQPRHGNHKTSYQCAEVFQYLLLFQCTAKPARAEACRSRFRKCSPILPDYHNSGIKNYTLFAIGREGCSGLYRFFLPKHLLLHCAGVQLSACSALGYATRNDDRLLLTTNTHLLSDTGAMPFFSYSDKFFYEISSGSTYCIRFIHLNRFLKSRF